MKIFLFISLFISLALRAQWNESEPLGMGNPYGPQNLNLPDLPLRGGQKKPQCQKNWVCFGVQGIFHMATEKKPGYSKKFTPPPGHYKRAVLRFRVYHGGWHKAVFFKGWKRAPRHQLFWFARDKHRDLLGYGLTQGPPGRRSEVFYRTDFGVPHTKKQKIIKPFLMKARSVYQVTYDYDISQGQVVLSLADSKGVELMRSQTKPNISDLNFSEGQKIALGFGFTGKHIMEPIQAGWIWSDLRVDLLPGKALPKEDVSENPDASSDDHQDPHDPDPKTSDPDRDESTDVDNPPDPSKNRDESTDVENPLPDSRTKGGGGDCAQDWLCFGIKGIFHTASRQFPVHRRVLRPPAGKYQRAILSFKVFHGGWHKAVFFQGRKRSPIHNLFWFVREKNRDLFGYAFAKGPPGRGEVTYRTDFGVRHTQKQRIVKPFLMKEGQIYQVTYDYNTSQGQITLSLADSTGREVMRSVTRPNISEIDLSKGQKILVDFGFSGEFTMEPIQEGWKWSDLRVDFLPQ